MYQLSVGIIMLVVSIGMVIGIRKYLATTSAGRMRDMMKCLALDPNIATSHDPQTRAIMKEVRKRCRKCQTEDVCERWLIGDVKGPNNFCPNAHIFRKLTKDLRNDDTP